MKKGYKFDLTQIFPILLIVIGVPCCLLSIIFTLISVNTLEPLIYGPLGGAFLGITIFLLVKGLVHRKKQIIILKSQIFAHKIESMNIIIQTIIGLIISIILTAIFIIVWYELVHLFIILYSFFNFNDTTPGGFISVGTLGIIMSIIGVIYHIKWKK